MPARTRSKNRTPIPNSVFEERTPTKGIKRTTGNKARNTEISPAPTNGAPPDHVAKGTLPTKRTQSNRKEDRPVTPTKEPDPENETKTPHTPDPETGTLILPDTNKEHDPTDRNIHTDNKNPSDHNSKKETMEERSQMEKRDTSLTETNHKYENIPSDENNSSHNTKSNTTSPEIRTNTSRENKSGNDLTVFPSSPKHTLPTKSNTTNTTTNLKENNTHPNNNQINPSQPNPKDTTKGTKHTNKTKQPEYHGKPDSETEQPKTPTKHDIDCDNQNKLKTTQINTFRSDNNNETQKTGQPSSTENTNDDTTLDSTKKTNEDTVKHKDPTLNNNLTKKTDTTNNKGNPGKKQPENTNTPPTFRKVNNLESLVAHLTHLTSNMSMKKNTAHYNLYTETLKKAAEIDRQRNPKIKEIKEYQEIQNCDETKQLLYQAMHLSLNLETFDHAIEEHNKAVQNILHLYNNKTTMLPNTSQMPTPPNLTNNPKENLHIIKNFLLNNDSYITELKKYLSKAKEITDYTVTLPKKQKKTFLKKYIDWMKRNQTNLKEANTTSTHFRNLLEENKNEMETPTQQQNNPNVISLIDNDQNTNSRTTTTSLNNNRKQPQRTQHSVTFATPTETQNSSPTQRYDKRRDTNSRQYRNNPYLRHHKHCANAIPYGNTWNRKTSSPPSNSWNKTNNTSPPSNSWNKTNNTNQWNTNKYAPHPEPSDTQSSAYGWNTPSHGNNEAQKWNTKASDEMLSGWLKTTPEKIALPPKPPTESSPPPPKESQENTLKKENTTSHNKSQSQATNDNNTQQKTNTSPETLKPKVIESNETHRPVKSNTETQPTKNPTKIIYSKPENITTNTLISEFNPQSDITCTTEVESATHTTNDITSSAPPKDINSHDTKNPYYIYIDAVIHHQSKKSSLPKREKIKIETIQEILNNIVCTLENTYSKSLAYVIDCQYKSTFKRDKRSSDEYSIFNMTLIPTEENPTPHHCNDIIETLYDYCMTHPEGTLQLNERLNPSLPAKDWIAHTSFKLPTVNHIRDQSLGLIIGITPDIHGRHHFACKWILKELFKITNQYLPKEWNCSTLAQFRTKFGIRNGQYRINNTTRSVYHVHASQEQDVNRLTVCLLDFQKNTGRQARIFNRLILVDQFPDKNNKIDAEKILNRIHDANKELKHMRTFHINKPLTPTNIPPLLHRIREIESVIIYTLRIHKNNLLKCYMSIHLPTNLNTCQLESNHFNYLTDDIMETSPIQSPSSQLNISPTSSPENMSLTFPTRQEALNQKRKTYIRMFDDSNSEREEEDDLSQDRTPSKKYYYAVRRGWRVGIYKAWSQARAATKNYTNAVHKKFPTLAQAEAFMTQTPYNNRNSRRPAIPQYPNNHKRTRTSYSEVARLPDDSSISRTINSEDDASLFSTQGSIQNSILTKEEDVKISSPENKIIQSHEEDTKTNTPNKEMLIARLQYICPRSYSQSLQDCIDSGTSLDTIKLIVNGWIEKVKNNQSND